MQIPVPPGGLPPARVEDVWVRAALGEVWAVAVGSPPSPRRSQQGTPRGSLTFRGKEPPGRQQVGRQGQLGGHPPPPRGCSCESWERGPGAAPSSLAPVSSLQPQPRAQLQLEPGEARAGQITNVC